MKLQRPLVVLDLETTGTWIDKDRIIEVGMIRCLADGGRLSYEKRVNPGMPIPPEVVEVTGINNDDVRDAPYFRQIAGEVLEFLADADLAGFNIERFDLPLLTREFSDAGIKFDYSRRAVYDAQKIYHLHERRDLTAAYNFYCHKELEGAHSAIVDSEATLEVLAAQLNKYGRGAENLDALQGFDYKQRTDFYDTGRKFRWWNGELYMMFGKYARKEGLKTIAQKDRKYLEWILTQNFTDEIKDLVEGALEGHFPQPPTLPKTGHFEAPPVGPGYQNELF
ncbi:MAG TPA: 3'-5' exonuclease [Candidatus Omnitrophota bacterium]|nr:3'-5' exonuclease [Candidatus Omnitrophota bacterium]